MRLGLILNDPEEEHDCFSDNTHNSHYYDGIGIQNVYLGRYTRLDGSVVSGPSPADLVAAVAPDVDARLQAELAASVDALGSMKAAADSGQMAYDQMLAPGNAEGEKLIMDGVNALITQTASIERAMAALGLSGAFEGSDSLDNPDAVFQ
jgi:putative iron-regulated protein